MLSHQMASTPGNLAVPSLHYVSSFHFDAAKSCYCRSGKPFGYCCGNPNTLRQPPKHLHIISNYLPANECKRLIRFAKKQKSTALSVVDTKRNDSKKTVVKRDASRQTKRILLGRKQSQVSDYFTTACKEAMGSMQSTKPQWVEAPHMLHYGPGGKYDIHADAEHFDTQSRRFYRFIDRDFSMLIYLNDDYVGGELNFPWLNYSYRPVAGDLVIFPANHIFTHESLPIVSGNKYALVSWGAFKGSARVRAPRSMLRIN